MATDKRRVAFTDEDGEHLGAYYLPADSVDCEDGDFGGLCAIATAALRGRSFARSSLYWAILAKSDLSKCNFEGADLRGAVLIGARLIDANLRDADLGLDALGGATQLHGADFTGAQLHGCRFKGAQYDENTRFPAGFDPQAAGMVETEPKF
ncbi:MAG: pentapeptide repeat-containing protein [Lysobacter sp.]